MDGNTTSARVRETRSSTPNGIFAAVVSMLNPWKKQLEEQFHRDMACQRAIIKNLEEKGDSSMIGRVKMLEEQLQDLRTELEDERDLRLENVKYFMECTETMTDKIVELGVQNSKMQDQLKTILVGNAASKPSSPKRQMPVLSSKSEQVGNKPASESGPQKIAGTALIYKNPPKMITSVISNSSSEPQKKNDLQQSSKEILHAQDPAKSFPACTCGRKFETKQALYCHASYFNKDKAFVCKPCGKRFPYAYMLKNHLRKDHNIRELTNADMLENLQESYNKPSAKAGPSEPSIQSVETDKRKRSSEAASINANNLNGYGFEESKKKRLSSENYNGHELEVGGSFEETEDSSESVQRYCLCNDVEYGEMVACDGQNCPREWFHYDCVGLTSEPKEEWYCLQCSTKAVK